MCDHCNSREMVTLHQSSGHNCCFPADHGRRTMSTSTQTQSFRHDHDISRSHELVLSTFPPSYFNGCNTYNNDSNNHYFSQRPRSQNDNNISRIESLLTELLGHCIDNNNNFDCCICESSRERSCKRRCTICEQERQILVCELTDLLEEIRCSNSSRCGIRPLLSGSSARQRHCCNISVHEVRPETQTLFEILFRITKRRSAFHSPSYISNRFPSTQSKSRHVTTTNNESTLKHLIKRILDELESTTSVRFDCAACHERIDTSIQRVRRQLRETECMNDQARCNGCAGCCESGGWRKSVICAPMPCSVRRRDMHC